MHDKPSNLWTVIAVSLFVTTTACSGDDSDAESTSNAAVSTKTSSGTTPDGAESSTSEAPADRIAAGIEHGLAHLASQRQDGGGFSLKPEFPAHPGITAMTLTARFNAPGHEAGKISADDRKALDWLVGLQKDDGSIFENAHANYCTSLAILALVSSGDERYRPTIDRATDFLARLQESEDNGHDRSDPGYGGIGYGSSREVPDMSNTQFALEAARAAGLPKNHAIFRRATTFLQRNQNWGETNDLVWTEDGHEVRPGNDGGAMYKPGNSKSGVQTYSDGRRVYRSYGSMSYALLKSYLFCGVDRNDPRVRAVVRWCRNNFELEFHPGFDAGDDGTGQFQGLFYYYFSMAKALRAMERREFTDRDGVARDWAVELGDKLLALQRKDGSFLNERNGRWDEDYGFLCTAYAVMALEECHAALARK